MRMTVRYSGTSPLLTVAAVSIALGERLAAGAKVLLPLALIEGLDLIIDLAQGRDLPDGEVEANHGAPLS